MSTRCNISIISSKFDWVYRQVYHHSDGYPKGGVGEELQDILNYLNMAELFKQPQTTQFESEQLAVSLMIYLCDKTKHDGYEYDGVRPELHGDIDYLYVIDLAKKKISCYAVDLWDVEPKDTAKYIREEIPFSNNYKKVYEASFRKQFKNIRL